MPGFPVLGSLNDTWNELPLLAGTGITTTLLEVYVPAVVLAEPSV